MTKIFIIVRNRSAIQYSYVATTRIRIVWTEMVRKKRTRLHVGCLNCFRPSIAKRQNDGNTIAYVFVRPLDPSKLAFSKKLHSRDRFWKPAFFVPENAVYVRKAKTENKSPFSKYPDKCGRGLRLVNGLVIPYNKAGGLFLYERRFSHSCNLYSKFLNFFVLPPSSKYL